MVTVMPQRLFGIEEASVRTGLPPWRIYSEIAAARLPCKRVGRRIYFSSERSGSPQIYVADVSTFAPTVARVSDAATGVFNPEVSPGQTELAMLLFKVDVGTAVTSDLLAALVMKPIGGGVHMARKTVKWGLVRWLCIGSVPGAILGAGGAATSGLATGAL